MTKFHNPFLPGPHDESKNRPEGFYHVLVKRKFYGRLHSEDSEEHEYFGFITVARWYANEWYLAGEVEPIPEENIDIVAERVKEYDNW